MNWFLRPASCLGVALLFLGGPLVGVSTPSKAGPPNAAPWVLVVEGDRLRVQLDRVPLPPVLAEVARHAGLRVSGSDAGDMLVSASFQDLPLDEAIQRLRVLGDQPHVLVCAPAPSAPGAPARCEPAERGMV